MLYFDDFMEAIESWPSEIREELSTIRHLDSQTHSATRSLKLRINVFFDNCNNSRLSEKEKEIEYDEILKDFDRLMDYSKQKIAIAEHIKEGYDQSMKKLDSDLETFRLELEADNSGLTSKIEHRIRTLLGRNMPVASRLDKRRAKFRSGNLFTANRTIPRRRTTFTLDPPDKQFYVLKRRFAAFDTPRNLPPPSPYSGNSTSFMSEDTPNPLMSDSSGRLLTSNGLRHVPSAGSVSSMDHNMQDHDFGPFTQDSQDYCDDEDDGLQLSFDGPKRGRSLGASRPTTGVSSEHQRLQQSGSFCYSPFMSTSDTEAVIINSGTSGVVADQSIDDLLTNPNAASASPSLKCGESPRWIGGAAGGVIDKTRRVLLHSRRPSQIGCPAAADINDESSTYIPSKELHHLPSSHRFVLTQSPARPLKDQQLQQQVEESETTNGSNVDERKYCLCKDVSYGDMVGCDGPNCPFEWFHYGCVNLTVAPKGKWYCPVCTANMKASAAGTPSASRKRMNRR